MNRWLRFLACIVGSALLLIAGLLIPQHIGGTPAVPHHHIKAVHDGNPWALAEKFLLYAASGYLLAFSLRFFRREGIGSGDTAAKRQFNIIREAIFSVGFVVLVLLLSEPAFTMSTVKKDTPFRLHLSLENAGLVAADPGKAMNNVVLATLLLFFVLQGLLYVACITKLSEILSQQVQPRIKLKLLENEEHLFDAGLYLGFLGTIVSLILVSMGIIKFSLMAAYSSTSFGVVFVCVFKIFHLRSARRKLLLEAEAQEAQAASTKAVASPSAPA
jgi:hypothetical protein